MDTKCIVPKIKDLPKSVQTQINDSLIKAQVVAQGKDKNRGDIIGELKIIQQNILKLLEQHPECQDVFEPKEDETMIVEFYKYVRYENEFNDNSNDIMTKKKLPNIPMILQSLKDLEIEINDYLKTHPFQKTEKTDENKKQNKNMMTILLQRKLLDVRSQIAELEEIQTISKNEKKYVPKYVFGLCNYEEMIEKGKLLYKDVAEHNFKDLETFLDTRNLDENKIKDLQKVCFDYLFMLKQLRSVCDIHLRKMILKKQITFKEDELSENKNYNPDHWKDNYIYGLFKTNFELFTSLANPLEGGIEKQHVSLLDKLVKLFDGLSIMQIHL
jgi:hypothetical protein